MMGLRELFLGVAVVLSFAVVTSLAECDCVPAQRPSAGHCADHVVLARVTSKQMLYLRVEYGIDVTKSFKGHLLEMSPLVITADTTACGLDSLEVGYEYVLSLDEDADRKLTVSSCGFNRLWALVLPSMKSQLNEPSMLACDKGKIERAEGVEAHFDFKLFRRGRNAPNHDQSAEDILDGIVEIPPEVEEDVAYDSVDYGDDIPLEEEPIDSSSPTEEPDDMEPEQPVNDRCENGPDTVEDGWVGQGKEAGNECNICMCIKGFLSCTKMQCFLRAS